MTDEATTPDGTIICAGDWVRDNMDNGKMRKISHIVSSTIYMQDGGVMGTDEITRDDVFLPGEAEGYN